MTTLTTPIYTIAAHGEGVLQSLTITPPLVEVGGGLSVGKEWSGSFTVVNPAPTAAEVELDLAGLRVVTLGADLVHTHTAEDTSSIGTSTEVVLVPEYERVLVMPQSSVTVPFRLKVFGIGQYRITLPLKPRSSYTTVDSVIISVRVVGPTLRCSDAEIDVGLVGVGAEGSRTISFTNESDVSAMYMMKPQLHVDINAGKDKGDKGDRGDRDRGDRGDKEGDKEVLYNLILPGGSSRASTNRDTHRDTHRDGSGSGPR
jgi:hypothetical protein